MIQMRAAIPLLSFLAALCLAASVRAATLSRGAYLAVLGDCAGCHTNGTNPPYAGGRGFSAAFGTVFSSNITPDKATGIGAWNKGEFYRALHYGVAPGWHYLYPAFPYVYFTHLDHADTDALFDYLRTVKPVRSTPPAARVVFPFNIRPLMWFWDFLFLDTAPLKSQPTKSASWNRGAWLVNGLGHCAACHTPKNMMFGDERTKSLNGADLENWFSANLNGNHQAGLGSWTADDIATYLKTGGNARATAVGSMQEVVSLSTSRMNNIDLRAIADYLKSLPPIRTPVPQKPDTDAMKVGEAVFVEHCEICHNPTNHASPRDYPALAGNTLVQAHNPETVLRVIHEGSQSAAIQNASISYSMPSFATLDDRDVADVATYIRNSWGNKAAPVSAKESAATRKRIAHISLPVTGPPPSIRPPRAENPSRTYRRSSASAPYIARAWSSGFAPRAPALSQAIAD